jgi:arylsulfatase A-like enzyme
MQHDVQAPTPAAGLWAAALAALLAGLVCACSAEQGPPSVLLVSIDTLRRDHCSVYGYERDTTPRLRAFAEQGVRFESAYAPMGLTGPSHATLFTSLYPLRHGVVNNGLVLREELTTLAEYLAAHGYQTAGVASSFVLARKFGFDQGFAFYDDAFDSAEATTELDEWEGHAVDEAFDRRGDHTTRRAKDWLVNQRDPEQPFFLFVHYFDPHSPYEAPEPAGARFAAALENPHELESLVAAYDGEILFVDSAIGGLLDALDELDLTANTLVIISADHGEGLMQRGYVLHGIGVHEEEVRVPLLMRWPASLRGGRVIEEPVELRDVLPTLAELLGFESAEDAFGGQSLAGALRGSGSLPEQRPIYLQRRHFRPGKLRPDLLEKLPGGRAVPFVSVKGEQFALRQGRWKLILAPDEAAPKLYDLRDDPEERTNLAVAELQHSVPLRKQLEAWIEAQRSVAPEAGSVSEQDRARLRALGYAD